MILDLVISTRINRKSKLEPCPPR
uniref:Uncharacterized protein n=1 Tax=Arundo donax TaxID=35708 RepID=A0A0A9CG55_ARUDO